MSVMNNINDLLAELAGKFAHEVAEAVRNQILKSIGVDEPASATPKPRRALGTDQIVNLLAQNNGGLRAEDIRKQLGGDKVKLAKTIKDLLASGAIKKTGQKRATVYFARGPTPPPPESMPEIETRKPPIKTRRGGRTIVELHPDNRR